MVTWVGVMKQWKKTNASNRRTTKQRERRDKGVHAVFDLPRHIPCCKLLKEWGPDIMPPFDRGRYSLRYRKYSPLPVSATVALCGERMVPGPHYP